MKIKNILLSATLSLALPLAAYADMPAKPAKCPSPSAIRSVGFDVVKQTKVNGMDVWALVKQANRYDTQEDWTFAIGLTGEYKNEQDALQSANTMLGTVKFDEPEAGQGDYWMCLSMADDMSYVAVALTPPQQIDLPLSVVKSYIHR